MANDQPSSKALGDGEPICSLCNGKGTVVAISPETGFSYRYRCLHNGRVEVPGAFRPGEYNRVPPEEYAPDALKKVTNENHDSKN